MTLDGVLLVVFIVLKLTGVIAWSWLWVLSPLWIGLLVSLLYYAWISFQTWRIRRHRFRY